MLKDNYFKKFTMQMRIFGLSKEKILGEIDIKLNAIFI